MSIASRQVKKEVSRIIQERMKDWYMPTIEYITILLSKYYRNVNVGFPSFKLRKQMYRKIWDVDKYNKNLSEIYDDLNNLYEELIDQFTIVLMDFDYYETERKKLMHNVKGLDGDLNALLLMAGNTEGYLYAVYDSFINRDKIDLNYTTSEINTDAGIITLRESRQGIKKLDMSHYHDIINFPILSEDKYADDIVSNKLLPGSKFGYVFSDVNSSWIQDIITKQSGELQVSFIIELDPSSDVGIYLSRIEILGQSAGTMYIEPLWSLDNINFRALDMGSGTRNKLATGNKKTVWNFAQTRMRYMKFLITKDQEDETIGTSVEPLYRHTIGFKYIEFYEMAYDKESNFYSSAFTVSDHTGEPLTIDKASLVVKQDIQAGTSIDYYLSLGISGVTDPSKFNWVAISPTNDPDPREAQIADFRHVAFFTNVPDIQWDSTSYGTTLETHYGIPFYKVYQFPYEPVRDSVSVYRGKDNWQVAVKYEVKRILIKDEEQVFGTGDTITLTYPTSSAVDGDGLIRGSIRVKSDAGDDPANIYINPSDYTVNYTTKVITRSESSTISSDSEAPSNTVYVDYQYDKEVAEPTEYTSYIYILNRNGIDIKINPFTSAEIEAGQFLTITTDEGNIDISTETSYHITPGWHKVITTAEPRGASDRFYSANNNEYLYQKVYNMYAYAEKLQEVSWFELKYNTLLLDHSKYCITDYDGDGNKEIIVNYKPQTTYYATTADDLLNPNSDAETYVLSYKYISTATNKIYLKAVLKRDDHASPLVTPTLGGYTIKLGY